MSQRKKYVLRPSAIGLTKDNVIKIVVRACHGAYFVAHIF